MAELSERTEWQHAPVHLFVPNTVYMVTASTYQKLHLFRTHDHLRLLHKTMIAVMERRGWELEAWALFSNHYHLIAKSPAENGDVRGLVRELHSKSALAINRFDETPARRVWFQYWDTCLTLENSYYARLNYVMQNPAHHGLVRNAQLYPRCSANWFAQNQASAFRSKVESFGFSRVSVIDDFEPVLAGA
jgi:putative transposase